MKKIIVICLLIILGWLWWTIPAKPKTAVQDAMSVSTTTGWYSGDGNPITPELQAKLDLLDKQCGKLGGEGWSYTYYEVGYKCSVGYRLFFNDKNYETLVESDDSKRCAKYADYAVSAVPIKDSKFCQDYFNNFSN